MAVTDLTKATQEELATRQKLLEEEIRLNQAELNEIYAEQDRRRG